MPKTARATGKRRRKTLKSYFKVLRNFQGFNLKDCKYEQEIRDKVFVPKCYGTSWRLRWGNVPAEFCRQCLLRPCLTDEYMREILVTSRSVEGRYGPAEERNKVENVIRAKMESLFGKRYVRGLPTPCCVLQEINAMLPDAMLEEQSDTEDELEFQGTVAEVPTDMEQDVSDKEAESEEEAQVGSETESDEEADFEGGVARLSLGP